MSDTQARHIQAISELEHQALARRSFAERLSEAIVSQAGRMWMIVLHLVWFGIWVVWNSRRLPLVRVFDPFPYPALTTVVSLEATFLSLFILISQNLANRRADERTHLDLQVNLLAEREATKMLQLLQALCAHHGLSQANDAEVTDLIRDTEPAAIAHELEKHLPAG
jgi:uncharacterized membrane protein